MVQWVRAFASQAEGWLFESQPRQTYVINTGNDSSTAKPSSTSVSVIALGDDNYKRIPRVTVGGARLTAQWLLVPSIG